MNKLLTVYRWMMEVYGNVFILNGKIISPRELNKKIRKNFDQGDGFVPCGGSEAWYTQCLENNEMSRINGDKEAMKAAWELLEREINLPDTFIDGDGI